MRKKGWIGHVIFGTNLLKEGEEQWRKVARAEFGRARRMKVGGVREIRRRRRWKS